MVLATGTWCAYNDWGGSNHYQGMIGPRQTDAAHDVSLLRPWAKGFVRWPKGAPRIPYASPLLTRPRYPHMEYARARGVSKKYASSGWAAFERPFALWCEGQGIGLDYMTQHDLHASGVPEGYDRVLIVGHDEYWTWEMRDHLEAWVDAGGQVARFAGNFYWQTRLSADLTTQTCWKVGPDPVTGARRTTYWDAPEVGRPAVATMGLTGVDGGLCRVEPLCRAWVGRICDLSARALVAAGHRAGVWRCAWAPRPGSLAMRSMGWTMGCGMGCPLPRIPRCRAA